MWALIVTLVLVGLILLGIEMLVIPGFGVVGVLGFISFMGSCYLAFTSFGSVVGWLIVAGELLLIVAFVYLVLRSKTWKKISLDTNISAKVDETPQGKGIVAGCRGIAVTRLAPGGNAEFECGVVEVFSRDSVIDAGAEIEVIDIEDNKVFVGKMGM